MTPQLKTKNATRDIDLHSEVAKLLREFIGGRTEGLVFPTSTGKPLWKTSVEDWLHPALRAAGVPTCGTHIFRRFRLTWLRKQAVPKNLERFWMGHATEEVGDIYSKLHEDVEYRKDVAERIGLGFSCTECTEISNHQEVVGVASNSQ